jgi:G6PDH family F420-dependent oxidoreductase
MAPGRFRFGIGSGESLNEHILGDTWPPVSIRLERLEEAVEVIRELWTGKTVTHEGKHFTVHNARLFTVPDAPPPIYLSGFGPEATELAARIADGWITTKPDAENLQLFRKTNSGVTQAGTKICWAASEDEAAETAYRLWGHQGQGGQASQDLPTWQSFAALAETNSPDQVKQSVPCGPDPQRAAASIREYVDAGFDEVYVSQMGKDQEGGIRFLSKEVLPLLQTG